MNSNITRQRYLNFYFQVHQPKRLRKFQFFDIGSSTSYFDESANEDIISRVAANCYLPANRMLLRLIEKHPKLRITFSLSGIVIEQLKMYSPETLDSFKALANTGAVEFLGETYYHSLACFLDENEFVHQVELHRDTVAENFGVVPTTFRNTELIYSDAIAERVAALGFKGIYFDGIERVLKGRTSNKVYLHPSSNIYLFPRNYRLSDDISFRYADQSWSEWPLTEDSFLRWLDHIPGNSSFTSLGMDYETLGEHQKSAGGIFDFMENLLSKLSGKSNYAFINPAEAVGVVEPGGIVSVDKPISWADQERDLSAWLGNDMQKDAFKTLKKLFAGVVSSKNSTLLQTLRYLQTSDHFYYISTKKGSDGNVHQYFSPYRSPYEAFMNYMNVLADIEHRLKMERFRQLAAMEVSYA